MGHVGQVCGGLYKLYPHIFTICVFTCYSGSSGTLKTDGAVSVLSDLHLLSGILHRPWRSWDRDWPGKCSEMMADFEKLVKTCRGSLVLLISIAGSQLQPCGHAAYCPSEGKAQLPEDNHTFEELKLRFTNAPVLHLDDPEKPFVLKVDASKAGWVQSSLNGMVSFPCAFFSRKLMLAERNYDVGNREFPFTIITDHKNLLDIQTAKHLTLQQAR